MHSFTILIVDDEPRNLKLLSAMLTPQDYRLITAQGGKRALEIASRMRPDLVLLDVMMPDIDGLEVCRRLKKMPRMQMVPIIMVTALREKEHRIRAMQAGADDFLSKPVDRIELLVRIKSLLRIKEYADRLISSHLRLRDKNRQLRDLEKTKEGLTHMIIHDLRSPLAAISGYIDLSLMMLPDDDRQLKKNLSNCRQHCDYLNQIIQSILDVYRMEQGNQRLNIKSLDPCKLAGEVRNQFGVQAASKQVPVELSCAELLPTVEMDPLLIKRVLGNLLDNAIRHTPKSECVRIVLDADTQTQQLVMRVSDGGPGLAPKYHGKIFNKFEQLRLRKSGEHLGSSGLGLTFCKMAVELHGGTIWVESDGENHGCTFCVQIPLAQPGAVRQTETAR